MKKTNREAVLRTENRRLRKENERLRARLTAFPREEPQGASASDEKNADARLSDRLESRTHYRKASFPAFLLAVFRASLLYGVYERLRSYFFRYRTAILWLQILLFLITIPRGGALFLSLSALSAVLLPVLLVLAVVLSQAASLRKRREKRVLTEALSRRARLYVFHFSKKSFPACEGAFLSLLSSVAEHDRAAVLVISPFLFSARGIGGARRYYVAARAEAKGVFLLRGYFYFGLRKRLMGVADAPSTVFF